MKTVVLLRCCFFLLLLYYYFNNHYCYFTCFHICPVLLHTFHIIYSFRWHLFINFSNAPSPSVYRQAAACPISYNSCSCDRSAWSKAIFSHRSYNTFRLKPSVSYRDSDCAARCNTFPTHWKKLFSVFVVSLLHIMVIPCSPHVAFTLIFSCNSL